MHGIISKLTSKPYVYGLIGLAGVGVGIGAYFLVKRMRNGEEGNDTDGTYFVVRDESGSFPDIPEGINETSDPDGDEKVVAPMFRKPDISDMVDYTKYKDKAAEYDTGSKIVDLRDAEVKPAEEDVQEDDQKFQEIDEETYLDPSNGMHKVDATYFTQEKILAGWNDDLKERDIDSTVGRACISKFDDPNVKSAYVRNLELSIDYEIVRCDDPFEEALRESLAAEE